MVVCSAAKAAGCSIPRHTTRPGTWHAATRCHCQVTIDQRDGELAIEVIDDGHGGTVDGTGYGIAGMRERAALLHGDLSAGPRPGGGFRVAARLPVPAPVR
jgi:signal transduction histidine kinase